MLYDTLTVWASADLCVLQLERLPYMVQGVWSENLEQQIDATTQFRKLLSIGMWQT